MSENIHIRRTKEGCAQITVGCITLTDTCVVHTKTYPNVLCTFFIFAYSPREQVS